MDGVIPALDSLHPEIILSFEDQGDAHQLRLGGPGGSEWCVGFPKGKTIAVRP